MPLFFLSIYFTKALRLTPCSKKSPGFSPSTKHEKPHLLVIRFFVMGVSEVYLIFQPYNLSDKVTNSL